MGLIFSFLRLGFIEDGLYADTCAHYAEALPFQGHFVNMNSLT